MSETREQTPRWKRLFGSYDAIIGLALAMILGAVYCVHPSRGSELRRLWHSFYAPLRSSGISLKGKYVAEHLESGHFSEWTHMLARGALTRWNERDVAPHAFDDLVERWEAGVWKSPDADELRAALEAFDASWRERRAEVEEWILEPEALAESGWSIVANIPGGEEIKGRLEIDELVFDSDADALILSITPPPDTPADAIGSVLYLDADVDSFSSRLGAGTLYWATAHLPQSGFRRVPAPEAEAVEKRGDSNTVRLRFDLSDEPGWGAEGAQVYHLRIDVRHLKAPLRIRALRGGD